MNDQLKKEREYALGLAKEGNYPLASSRCLALAGDEGSLCDEPDDNPPDDDSPDPYDDTDEQSEMTIAIGFLWKEGIILASDSQMSYRDGFKRHDGKKVFWLNFAGSPNQVAVAFAGDARSATEFKDILEEKARMTELTAAVQIRRLVRDALTETRQRIQSAHNGLLPDNKNFRALIAYHWNGKPSILLANSEDGFAQKITAEFEAIGCGLRVANFILYGDYTKSLPLPGALAMAIYTINACKKFDTKCGGPFQYVILNRGEYGGELSRSVLRSYKKAAKMIDKKFRKSLSFEISHEAAKVMEERNQRWIERHKAKGKKST